MSTPMPENILNTRLSKFLRIDYPILLAPMAMISGGRLAAAVTSAGGLGLIGGGYGDKEWLQREFDHAAGTKVGCGFITWRLAKKPELLDQTLARQPAAIMLSFGDLHSFADRVRAAGVPLIAQVQTVDQAAQALDAGTDIIVAQGGEAGGHGMAARSSFTLVPEVADLAAERRPEALVVLAGGVADGRGLAAALALGADGVLVGTRFWASSEALVSPRAHQRAIQASGDDTFRTRVYDVVRRVDWPAEYNERALGNSFLDRWHGNEAQLQAVGLIDEVRPAADIVRDVARDAAGILGRAAHSIQG